MRLAERCGGTYAPLEVGLEGCWSRCMELAVDTEGEETVLAVEVRRKVWVAPFERRGLCENKWRSVRYVYSFTL